MIATAKESLYVPVKDRTGNEFVCPLDRLANPGQASDDELEHCVEKEVVGRYAGQLKMA